MRRTLALATSLAVAASLGAAFGVSDGNYSYNSMHCSGGADNYDKPAAEEGCYTVILTLSDLSGHEYLGAGVRQAASGSFQNTLDVWVDPDGIKRTVTFSPSGVTMQPPEASTLPHPETGLRLYFGGDDNLNHGEHDSSPQVSNGPSDGGGIQLNISPDAAHAWLEALQDVDLSYLLTHALPGADFGTGACADGICFSVTTQRRVAFVGGDTTGKTRAVANYEGKLWDPPSCSGTRDGVDRCSYDQLNDPHILKDWNDLEGTVYVDPGIQIYEDPDAQASPAGPYPLPALYVGTCGAIFGGGNLSFNPGPSVNGAGQLVFPTAC
jgi:hypothetical protein